MSQKMTLGAAMAALLLSACGGKPIQSKEEASKAVNRLAGAGQAGNAGSALAGAAAALPGVTVTVKGKKGSAKVTFVVDANATAGSFHLTETFDGFSDDGRNYFDGTMDYVITVSGSATGASIDMTMKGKVDISGELSDTLDVSIRTTTSITGISDTAATATMTLDGTVTTSHQSFQYANENVTVSVSGKS